MSYVRIWIHCVWGTKNRVPFLNVQNKKIFLAHIRENAENKNIYIDFINGHTEHVHTLISLNKDQSIAAVMQMIKGESSHWINKAGILKTKFEWADKYFVVSVGESQLNRVRNYIKNQEEHHRIKTWIEECNEFMDKYGFSKLKG